VNVKVALWKKVSAYFFFVGGMRSANEPIFDGRADTSRQSAAVFELVLVEWRIVDTAVPYSFPKMMGIGTHSPQPAAGQRRKLSRSSA